MFAMEDQKILTYAIAETVLSSAKADTALRDCISYFKKNVKNSLHLLNAVGLPRTMNCLSLHQHGK